MFKKVKEWLDSDEALSWINPIPCAKLEINMRNFAGQSCFWLTSWYNFNLLFFRIFGTLRLLGKKQAYYDACIEHNKNKRK